MKTTLSVTLSATALLVATVTTSAFAQDANALPGAGDNPPVSQLGAPEALTPGPDQPAPLTGELVPLPVAPPEGAAARIKLPDCAPPNCGVPQIMAQ